jgi:hypothetical protein
MFSESRKIWGMNIDQASMSSLRKDKLVIQPHIFPVFILILKKNGVASVS